MKSQSFPLTGSADRASDARQVLVALVCFFILSVDGFDTASIAFVAPTLAMQWHVSPSALTPAFVMTSVGAVVGYVISGHVVSRLGQRNAIMATTLAFGICSFVSPFASSVATMSLLRFMTAVCLGCAVPATIACAAASTSKRNRPAVTIAVTTGLSVGTAVGGILATFLLTYASWGAVFLAGGAGSVILAPLVALAIRNPAVRSDASHQGVDSVGPIERPGVRLVFRNNLAIPTMLIWAIAFFAFLVTYQFLFWLPTLLVAYGFEPSRASLGSTACALGGITGSLALIPVVRRFGVQRLLIVMACVALVCIGLLVVGSGNHMVILLLIAGVGAGAASNCVGQTTLAVVTYPSALRTAGVGYASAAGRIGAIVGPAAGGLLLSFGLQAKHIVLLACVPIALVILLLAIFDKKQRKSERGQSGGVNVFAD